MSYPRFKRDPLAKEFIRLVDVVFGVLLAQGLLLYRGIILNPMKEFPKTLSLLAVYVIIMFSWYGYHKSILQYPYNLTTWSRIRLMLDLLILVSYAYILYGLDDPLRLLLGSTMAFLLYFITGLVRIKEWNDSKVSKYYLNVTFFGLFLACFLALKTQSLSSYTTTLLASIITILLVIIYRIIRLKIGYPSLKFVGVDIDGVLAEQVPHILKWLKEKEGINHNKTKSDIKSWTEPITDEITIDEAIERALLNEEFVEEMPVVLGSTKAMEQMYEKYHVVIASSRPKEAEEATKRWLNKFFKYHEYVNTRDIGKHKLGLDILIDDNLENIKNFCKAGGKLAIIFNQPWNQSEDYEMRRLVYQGKVIRCNSWNEILEKLQDITRKL